MSINTSASNVCLCTTRWKYIMGKYVKYTDYWNKKAQQRKIGSRAWRHAWYRWRRNIWRQYNWYWWMIRFDSKRSRKMRRCKDKLKELRASISDNRKKRREVLSAYRKQQKEWTAKLKSSGRKRAYKRARRSKRRQKARKTWRGKLRKLKT